jgi:hypothetical protein
MPVIIETAVNSQRNLCLGVGLGVKLPTAGDFTLIASEITVVGETVHLEARMLNIFQDLNLEPVYNFNSAAGNISTRCTALRSFNYRY